MRAQLARHRRIGFWFGAPGLLVLAFAGACGGSNVSTEMKAAETPDGSTIVGSSDGAAGEAKDGGTMPVDTGLADTGVAPCTYPPVTLPFTFSKSTNGGTTVYQYAPPSPVGLIVELHGTGGSSTGLALNKVEWASFHADAVAKGYAVLVAESDDRDAARWSNAQNANNNPDYARLAELIDDMRAAGSIAVSTPIYVMGMSQGGGVTPILSSLLLKNGYPVKATAVYCAGGSKVYQNATYEIPVTFNLMAADAIVSNPEVQASFDALSARKVDTAIFIKPAEKACRGRFTRIASITRADSEAIFDSLVAGGTLQADGTVTIQSTDLTRPTALPGLPAAYSALAPRISEELGVLSAQHQFYGDRNAETLAFFAAHK